MDITRSGSQPSGKGPSEYFTGAIRLDPLFEAPAPARAVGVSITLEPGAREAWHSHQASPDADRDRWLWPGPTLGWSHRGHSTRGRDLVPAGRETLARRHANHSRDVHRHSGTA